MLLRESTYKALLARMKDRAIQTVFSCDACSYITRTAPDDGSDTCPNCGKNELYAEPLSAKERKARDIEK